MIIPQKILVTGGSGFVGRHVVATLVKAGYSVLVPTRRRERAKHLLMLPRVDVVEADILRHPTQIPPFLKQCHGVINLIGILHGSGRQIKGQSYNNSFSRVLVEWPQSLVQAIVDQRNPSIKHLIHMSSLGASVDAPSQYLRARADGENIIRSSSLPFTILRPSIIAGENAAFFQQINALIRMLPVLIMPGADFKMQPVGIHDVAQVVINALNNPEAMGKTYELGGPEVYTLAELVHILASLQGRDRIVLNLPMSLAKIMAWFSEFLPNPFITRDNLASMTQASTTEEPLPFGLRPTPLTSSFSQQYREQDMRRFRMSARR